MARSRQVFKRDAIPFLPEKAIEAEAQLLLDEFADAKSYQIAAPIPVEDIIELHLSLSFVIEDLHELLHVDDVLGAIWFDEKRISVDVRLDPTANPRLLGRFRFTLGHEAGHWRLHRKYCQENPAQGKLFNGREQPAFICRSSSKPREELQADMFSGFLLMPRNVVRTEWQTWRGNLDAVPVQHLPNLTMSSDRQESENVAIERFCRLLADRFEVSAEAMRIRLESLGFLTHEECKTLF